MKTEIIKQVEELAKEVFGENNYKEMLSRAERWIDSGRSPRNRVEEFLFNNK